MLTCSYLKEVEAALAAQGILDATNFTPQGPAGIFALYVTPGSKLGQVFLNEFICVCTVFIGHSRGNGLTILPIRISSLV